MCRLMLCNKAGEKAIQEKYGLEKFLKYLEVACGGSGNGVSLLKNKKIIFLKKGVKYSCSDIAKKLQSTDYDWCAFHTRISSIGAITNRNCHPFKVGNTVLAMNGTESSYKDLSEFLGKTDSEVILQLIKKFNLPLLPALSRLHSAFIGFNNGIPYAVYNGYVSHSLELYKHDDAMVFASQFPDAFEGTLEAKKKPMVWYEGAETEFVPVKHYSYGSYLEDTCKADGATVTKDEKGYHVSWNDVDSKKETDSVFNKELCGYDSRGWSGKEHYPDSIDDLGIE